MSISRLQYNVRLCACHYLGLSLSLSLSIYLLLCLSFSLSPSLSVCLSLSLSLSVSTTLSRSLPCHHLRYGNVFERRNFQCKQFYFLAERERETERDRMKSDSMHLRVAESKLADSDPYVEKKTWILAMFFKSSDPDQCFIPPPPIIMQLLKGLIMLKCSYEKNVTL